MSREITIGYRLSNDSPKTNIEIRAPYYLLGTQSSSMRFWSLPHLREIGILNLTELGVLDPIYFDGWDMLKDLHREIGLLESHMESIEFDAELMASWLSHLVYCHALLVLTAPRGSTPSLTIG